MSTSRGNVVDPWQVIDAHGADAFRWYLLTAQQPWAVYRFSAETVGEAVRQFLLTLWNTYSFFVLYANAEGLGPRRDASRAGGRGPISTAGRFAPAGVTRTVIDRMDDFDCTTAGREIAELRRGALELVRAALPPPLLGRRPRPRSRPCATAWSRSRSCSRRSPRSSPTRSTTTSAADGDSVHLSDYPEPDPALEDGELEAGVEAAMRAIELGRAARAQAKVKNRQPLRSRGDRRDRGRARARSSASPSSSRAELNVKELEFVSEQGELVTLRGEAQLPRARAPLRQGDAAGRRGDRGARPGHVAEAIRGERRIGINVDGADHPLEPDDVTLVMQPLDGYEVEAEAGRAVALALELDDELRREGLAREIVHAIQDARKDAGLEVSDRIVLTLGGDDALLEAARTHEGYVAGETLATSVVYDGAAEARAAAIDGRELRIGIERAGVR